MSSNQLRGKRLDVHDHNVRGFHVLRDLIQTSTALQLIHFCDWQVHKYSGRVDVVVDPGWLSVQVEGPKSKGGPYKLALASRP